jgi:hypothetical protein
MSVYEIFTVQFFWYIYTGALYCSVYSHCYAMTARWVNKHRPFIGNGSLNTFPRQRIRKRHVWKPSPPSATLKSFMPLRHATNHNLSILRTEGSHPLYRQPYGGKKSLCKYASVFYRRMNTGRCVENVIYWLSNDDIAVCSSHCSHSRLSILSSM